MFQKIYIIFIILQLSLKNIYILSHVQVINKQMESVSLITVIFIHIQKLNILEMCSTNKKNVLSFEII